MDPMLGMEEYTCNPCSWGLREEGWEFKAILHQSGLQETLSKQINKQSTKQTKIKPT